MSSVTNWKGGKLLLPLLLRILHPVWIRDDQKFILVPGHPLDVMINLVLPVVLDRPVVLGERS